MCGIAGVFNFHGRPALSAQIETLTSALTHRGRDSAAVIIGGTGEDQPGYAGLALGHRRLSIIDLSAHAIQPMRTSDGKAWIVYNGELYNYRELRTELMAAGWTFHTDSDTEVVLNAYLAWGEAALPKLNGMFAFAVWREAEQSLFCARDPFGIKPFYYSLDGDGFRFASESQALVKGSHHNLDPEALRCYFLSMYVPRHLSLFTGVRRLLPGHSMRIAPDGCVETRRYWFLPTTGEHDCTADEAVEQLRHALDQAVARQLVSDVPVGALLSGGFDSGMIVAAAAARQAPLHTYSIGFDDGHQYNELPIARAMADRYGTVHHERVVRSTEIIGLLDAAIAGMSEPVADSAMVPTYCLAGMAAADGVKVLLSGAGGDEVFGGYARYVGNNLQRRLFHATPQGVRRLLGRSLGSSNLFGARLRHASVDMMLYTGGSVALTRQLLGGENELVRFVEHLAEEVYPLPQQGAVLYQNMQFDLQVYLPDELLMLLDQLTMAHTVEGRVPYLDIDLVKASYALAAHLHAVPAQAQTRKLMRKMAIGRLDPRTFSAPKQGFSGPLRHWVLSNRAIFCERVMQLRDMPELADLDLEALWRPTAEQAPDWALNVFLLYCFSVWAQSHATL